MDQKYALSHYFLCKIMYTLTRDVFYLCILSLKVGKIANGKESIH